MVVLGVEQEAVCAFNLSATSWASGRLTGTPETAGLGEGGGWLGELWGRVWCCRGIPTPKGVRLESNSSRGEAQKQTQEERPREIWTKRDRGRSRASEGRRDGGTERQRDRGTGEPGRVQGAGGPCGGTGLDGRR